MNQSIFSNDVPSPFDMLVSFQDSGNASFISHLFREKAEWLSRNLSPEQQEICDSIRVKLADWEEIERQRGLGAALNLNHPKMMGIFREQPWVKRKYAAQIANAERQVVLEPTS